MSAIFITATGTDVGKTFVASGLIRHFRSTGRAVDALKPVVSGFDPTAAERSDPGRLLAALGRPVTPAELDGIAPFRFAAPLSPDMAARRENRSLDFGEIVAFSQRAIAAAPGVLLIEGVGGVMVPLDDSHTVLDWMLALGVPLVVVTGTHLGTVSHTLTGLDVLKQRGLSVKALVVNETPGSAVALADTLATIARFTPTMPIIALPRLRANAAEHPAIAAIAKLL